MTNATVEAPVYFIKFISEQTHPNRAWGNLTTVKKPVFIFPGVYQANLYSHSLDQS